MGNRPEKLGREYARVRPELESGIQALARHLRESLRRAGVPVISFSQRVKAEESLRGKLARPDRNYASLWDVTDLVGLRVVVPFEDAIDDAAKVIERECSVDLARSRNRLFADDHDRFGYRSLHYVCLWPEGSAFARPAPEARFEIQVRTALQDAWAEIEHDLGYKASDLAPSTLRRRFSRVASLLEIADEELVAVRRELREYVEGRRDHSRLDAVSILKLCEHEAVAAADSAVADWLGRACGKDAFFPDYLLRALRLAELTTIEDALKALAEFAPRLPRFLPAYFEFAERELGFDRSSISETPRGYSLLFLAHARIAAAEPLAVNRAKRYARFYEALDFPKEPARAQDAARALVATLDRAGI